MKDMFYICAGYSANVYVSPSGPEWTVTICCCSTILNTWAVHQTLGSSNLRMSLNNISFPLSLKHSIEAAANVSQH